MMFKRLLALCAAIFLLSFATACDEGEPTDEEAAEEEVDEEAGEEGAEDEAAEE